MAIINTSAIEVKGLDQVQRLMQELPAELFPPVKETVARNLLIMQEQIQKRIRDGAGNTLHSRTGALRRSIQQRVTGHSFATLDAQIWSDSPYAPTHEGGGPGTYTRIEAKSAYASVPGGPYLNIPLPPNKTAAGVTRKTAREVFGAGGYIRKSRHGNWLVFLGDQPMFVLKKSVTIPARLHMWATVERVVPELWFELNEIPVDVAGDILP